MMKYYKLGFVRFSNIELRDLFKAWLAISIAFAIVLSGKGISLLFSAAFLPAFLISGLTVGFGFLLHEMGHKVLAQRYGCAAEFRSFDRMLMFAIIMSFFGFVFAAPGGVFIGKDVGVVRNGKISMMGPLINLVLGILFLGLFFLFPAYVFIWKYGVFINVWLGLFNLIPFWNFDGKKILHWNKFIYGAMVIIALMMFFSLSYVLA